MKGNAILLSLCAILCVLLTAPAIAQTATVKGRCVDAQGNPIVDGQVVWHNDNNGRTFRLKTNNKGEYFSLGLEPGKYTVTLSKDGKDLDKVNGYPVPSDEVTLDFDLKKSQEQAVQQAAKDKGMTAEQVKQAQAQQANAEKMNTNIKAANEKLKAASAQMDAASTAMKAGDTATANTNYDGAIATLNETAQMVPNEDYVWYRLGSAYLTSAKTQTDAAEKTKRNTEAYNDLQKAIDMKKEAMKTPPQGDSKAAPQAALSDNQKLAAYYDGLAQAAVRTGKVEEAATAYKQAAELDPQHADNYYFNLGAILTNYNSSGDPNMRKQAVEAFDKAIAANPNNAEAYYQKGQSLIGMATMQDNKLVAPAGTEEAFKKYLELKPDGPNAQAAKDTLTLLGSKIETSYGTAKKKKQ
jgi:tetratricopeptide (TPR) repeat protein